MGLTAKQQAFVDEYALDWNATQAAIRAGYAPAGAHTRGTQLLRNDAVALAIADKQAERRSVIAAVKEEPAITRIHVIRKVKMIAEEAHADGDRRNALTAYKMLGDAVGAWGEGNADTGNTEALRAIAELGLEELRAIAYRKRTTIEGETAT